uniref:Uncharacterized protein n=1 Tax=Romanomermis culicivorax TaxID=13658 RepID=A0A915HE26_ROMCU
MDGNASMAEANRRQEKIQILPIDDSEGPLAQAPACSQQALENPLGDPINLFRRNGTVRQQLETLSMKIHFRSESITAILWETTDGNPQPSRTERKFAFRSVSLCRLHSVSSKKTNQVCGKTKSMTSGELHFKGTCVFISFSMEGTGGKDDRLRLEATVAACKPEKKS